MVPREAGRGRSFKGAALYYLHDRGAMTSERVAFTHTENIPTNDPHKAVKWMAWTAINAEELKRESGAAPTGRPCRRPVFTFSLAWHPEEEVRKWDMIRAGRQALLALGLEKHETVMVSHDDRPHPHLHLIVNVIHPETGKASRLSYSRTKLSRWAQEYEERRGKVYCDQRVENNARRDKGEKVKYREPEIDLKARVTELYKRSDSAIAFQAALEEEGLTLAQGKRIVLIDREGNIHSLYRQIEGAKAKDIKAMLAGLELPDVDEARGRIEEAEGAKKDKALQDDKLEAEEEERKTEEATQDETEAVYFDRDEQDREWQESIIDAAIKADQDKKPEPEAAASRRPPPRTAPSPAQINALQDRQLAELGRFYVENTQSRMKLDFTLGQQYGQHERELRRNIDHLEQVLENSGPLRRLWLTVWGQIPRDPEQELQNMRLTLGNIEWRKNEALQALEQDAAHRRQEIQDRHLKERQELQPKLVQQAAYDEPEPDEPSEETEMDEDFGPSFEY